MEGFDFDAIDWDAEVVPELVPLAQSAHRKRPLNTKRYQNSHLDSLIVTCVALDE